MLLTANEIDQVGHVGLVEHGEVGRKPQPSAVQSQQAVRDRVECAAPDFAGALTVYEPPGARKHLACGAARERQQQNAFGWHPLLDQVRDATRERPRLARARTGDDQHRPFTAGDRLELRGVECRLPRFR